jgi:hypothetical protein
MVDYTPLNPQCRRCILGSPETLIDQHRKDGLADETGDFSGNSCHCGTNQDFSLVDRPVL